MAILLALVFLGLCAPLAGFGTPPRGEAGEQPEHPRAEWTIPAGLRTAIDRAVQEELEQQGAIGIAVGVIRDRKVVYTAGYGLADRERGVPVTRETMFRWASISKPLTAVAAAQLADRGDLDLDQDIRILVPEYPDHAHPITTRQLLGHLAGIVHYSNGVVIPRPKVYDDPHPYRSVINAIDRFAISPLVCTPGERYSYSTHGYILASAAIERAGGALYADQVRDRICRPLGLTSLTPDYQWEPIEHRAVGYRKLNDRVVPSGNTDVSWKLGGGGWISNIDDLAAFASGLMGDRIVDDEIRELLWTVQADGNGEPTGYALGFSVDRQGGTLRVAHNGRQEKASARMVLYPERGHGVVVMSNSEFLNPGRVTTAIYKAIDEWQRSERTP
ncbi:MAG: serine hydrolase domain-containing protein [Phycisphaerales bacterium]